MKTRILLSAGLLLSAADLRAQSPQFDVPACAEGGIARLALTVPPGQTREEVVAALQASGSLPEGTQVRILGDHEKPPILNVERFRELVRMHIHRFLDSGIEVNGEATTLVMVDAEGRVTEVDPGSGHREVDRSLRNLWRQARFEPVVVGSCRVPAYLHLNLRFATGVEYRETTTSVEVRP